MKHPFLGSKKNCNDKNLRQKSGNFKTSPLCQLHYYIIFVFEVSGIKLTKSTYLSFTAIKN